MFVDRLDAGERLARALSEIAEDSSTLICGIPREGVVLSVETGRHLGVESACLVVCRIGVPCFPEHTLGAIGPDGEVAFDPKTELTRHEVMKIGRSIRTALAQKIERCRGGKPEPGYLGRTIVVMDEVTDEPFAAQAAAQYLRRRGAERLVLASVVITDTVRDKLAGEFDEILALRTDPAGRDRRQVYMFPQRLADSEIEAIMKAAI